MSGDFGGYGFAPGSVTGYRSWNLEKANADSITLKSISWDYHWSSAENLAECRGNPGREVLGLKDEMDYSVQVSILKAFRESLHSMEDCTHGFYAYFGTKWVPYNASIPSITGVIEGYGEVVIGTRGFRAMKSRIKALCVESWKGMWDLKPEFIEQIRPTYQVPIFSSLDKMVAEYPATDPTDYMSPEARERYETLPYWNR